MKKKLSLLMTFMLCFAIGAWADTYTVVGAVLGGDGSESPGFFLSYWDINYPGNDMEEQEGVFVKKYENLELEQCRILFKVVKNHSWDVAYPENNYVLNIPEDGQYTVTITFNEVDKQVSATATKTGDAVIPDANITAVQLPGDWNWALEKGEGWRYGSSVAQ